MPFASLADIVAQDEALGRNIEAIYAWRRCGLIADTLARATGLPLLILNAHDEFGHAAVIVDQCAADQMQWRVADVMGIRTIAEVKRVYEDKIGPLDVRIIDDLPEEYSFTFETKEIEEGILLLAGRLPWLREMVPEEYRQQDDERVVGDLHRIMAAIPKGSLETFDLLDQFDAEQTLSMPGC